MFVAALLFTNRQDAPDDSPSPDRKMRRALLLGVGAVGGAGGLTHKVLCFRDTTDWRPLFSKPGSEGSALKSKTYPLVVRRGTNKYSLEQVSSMVIVSAATSALSWRSLGTGQRGRAVHRIQATLVRGRS